MNIKSGQNVLLNEQEIKVNLINGKSNTNIVTDISIFLLNKDGKVSDDNDFIFFNN